VTGIGTGTGIAIEMIDGEITATTDGTTVGALVPGIDGTATVDHPHRQEIPQMAHPRKRLRHLSKMRK